MYLFSYISLCFLLWTTQSLAMEPIVLVHGGAGDIPESRVPGKMKGVKHATRMGYAKLKATGSVMDAVEEAVRQLEVDEYFNAGYGSVLTIDGEVEMDASIMNGSSLKAGCVTGIKEILHPISVARKVMETPHTFLAFEGAMKFAKEAGFEILDPPGQLITEYSRQSLLDFLESQKDEARVNKAIPDTYGEVGTVGAVAIDENGNIAAATSTGGITGKWSGRVGDTPILGSGTYANNLIGGVSTTGHGETIMRYNLAHAIIARIKLLNKDAQTATEESLEEMTATMEGTAGAITIDYQGNVGIYFTSTMMAWAYQKQNCVFSGIYKNQQYEEECSDEKL